MHQMKKATKVLVLGAAIVALAAPVHAATTIDFNIYGASAQFTFWNAAAPGVLPTVRKCGATSQVTYDTGGVDTANDKKHEVTTGVNCDGATPGAGTTTINLRYSSKASYDGINAVKNIDAANTCPGQPNQRKMIIDKLTLGCQNVHLGASDVAGETFTQQSHGQKFGPLGGGKVDAVYSGISTTGLTPYNPIVVPFGFFVNNAVKVYTCQGGTHDGNYCTTGTAVADCGTGITCAQNILSNITREQVVQIFGGNTAFWQDFGQSYPAGLQTVACLRHAGSGTHATFDKVFFTGANPNALVQNENAAGPILWFNDGASDLMKCVNGNSTATPTGSAIGAIGYADADQANLVNTSSIKYNGLFARRNVIRNGSYDFFTNEWLYENQSNTGATGTIHDLIIGLNTFASNPANITTYLGTKAYYWASQTEMNFNKTSDANYPGSSTATSPQIP
jgi:hypothetical protein